jgi:hypothetical protein
MSKIVFFNHYHRGDLHTHKEFIRQIQNELPEFEFEYLHNNPAKLLLDLGIPTVGNPNHLNSKEPFYAGDGVLYVNTWVGCDWDIFCKHGGINMHTLCEQWENIFEGINQVFETELKLNPSKEHYLPRIDYTKFDTSNIDSFLDNDGLLVLICNNVPNSNQSFDSDMSPQINSLAKQYPTVTFVCTNKFTTEETNIAFTQDIIKNTEGIDLQEISYLSTHCDIIIGKNSGPYVFCETCDNYMDASKTFISFNIINPSVEGIQETMSNGLDLQCKYITVPIENVKITDKDTKTIIDVMTGEIDEKIKTRVR